LIKYRPDPNNPGEMLVEASPRDVHALRRAIFGYLARWGVPSREHDDLVQWVEIVTWRKLEAGQVRGFNDRTPKAALLCFMIVVAWNAWRNLRSRSSTRREILAEENEFDASVESAEKNIEARDILRRIEMSPQMDLGALREALGFSSFDEAGKSPTSYSKHLAHVRRWMREIHASGKWSEPPKLPRSKKRKR
jgi:DNA-directed RNA polymerase specialized sigma24 family protein